MRIRIAWWAVALVVAASVARAEQAKSLSAALVNGVAIDAAEWDGMAHLTATDANQLRAVVEQSRGWLPWDPAMFDSAEVVWIDFARLPQDPGRRDQTIRPGSLWGAVSGAAGPGLCRPSYRGSLLALGVHLGVAG